MERAEATVLALADDAERVQGLTPRARVVLGFSQGGYLGAWMALRRPERFHGMVVSGARVKAEWLAGEMRRAARTGFTALLCHGVRDTAVRPEAAFRSRDALAAAGVAVELRMFESGHSIGREQVAAIGAWLTAQFGGATAAS
jgi:predicted esterase